jgi:hypothetical protein
VDGTPIHVDEFGTVRFVLFSDDGRSYEFEQEVDSDLLFVTLRDNRGRAKAKRVVNTAYRNNKEIVETYKTYIREQNESGSNEY